MWAVTGWDLFSCTVDAGFLENARWHRNAPWGESSAQEIADTWRDAVKIGSINTTPLGRFQGNDAMERWADLANHRIRNSSCMVVLLAADPRLPRDDHGNALWIQWELQRSAQHDIPVYVMRRTNENWMADDEVDGFLGHALRSAQRNPVVSGFFEGRSSKYEGWDEKKWAYPGMSRFLDKYCSVPQRL